MEGVGFMCYETEVGGDGALFMEDIEDEDAKQGAPINPITMKFEKNCSFLTVNHVD